MSRQVLPEHLRSHPNWLLALDILCEVLPGSSGFDPGDLPGLQPSSWQRIDLDGPDDVIAERLWTIVDRPASTLYLVVTFASYLRAAGPFLVLAADLDDLIHDHAAVFDDLAFSTDFLLVALDTGIALVVTHDGGVATLRGKPWRLAADSD